MTLPAAALVTPPDRLTARRFIEAQGLPFEDAFDDLVGIYEAGSSVATGARAGYVLKMFAIDQARQGGGLLGALVTELMRLGRAAGHERLLGLHAARTRADASSSSISASSSRPDRRPCSSTAAGSSATWRAYARLRRPGPNGAVVVNGNPFTLGHLYLVETAARLGRARSTCLSSARTARCSRSKRAAVWRRRRRAICRTSSCSTRLATPCRRGDLPVVLPQADDDAARAQM